MTPLMNWIKAHPRLTAWLVLALGMNAMLIYEARNVGLLTGQWIALIVATTLVAGLCVWIIGWEDDDEDDVAVNGAAAAPVEKPAAPPSAPRPAGGKK
jgi:hypothetical protein